MSSVATQQCPNCQSSIPVYEGFISWCEQCNWNVRAGTDNMPMSFLDRFYTAMSRKHSSTLFENIVRAGVRKPPFSLSIALAYVLAALIHLWGVALFVGGVLLVVLGWPYFFIVLAGVLCLGVTWLMRPRFAPKPTSVLAREHFPMLYQLVDTISAHLGTPPVDGIVIDTRVNAGFGRVGIKQEKILWLGLPLWYALSNEERVDLLAHEIAHDVNNDYRETFLVGSAIRIVVVLYNVLIPTEIWPISMGLMGFAAVPFTLLSLGLAHIVRYCTLAFEQLLWSNSQRAEYYADILAASVAGKQAALGGMEKLMCARVVSAALRSFALERAPKGDVFERVERAVAAIPRREVERLRRASLHEAERMDTSHPPTALRLAMIEKFAPSDAALHFPKNLFQSIEEELQAMRQELQRRIVDDYRASLYRDTA